MASALSGILTMRRPSSASDCTHDVRFRCAACTRGISAGSDVFLALDQIFCSSTCRVSAVEDVHKDGGTTPVMQERAARGGNAFANVVPPSL